jgi:hypothetical protein
MLSRPAISLTHSVCLRLSQSPCYRCSEQSSFHSPYTLPSAVSRKSFACHSYENCRGCVPTIPNSELAVRHSPLHSSSFFSDSCALFCTRAKLNPILFNRLRTLYEKHTGVVYPSSPKGRLARNYCGRIRLILTSLPHPCLISSRNGDALPAAMGAAAKRAHRLQERSSCPVIQLFGGGG